MTRICGVCKQPPREGQIMIPIRITEDDLHETGEIETGLYSACKDCAEAHRTRLAARLNMETRHITNNALA